MPLIHTGPISNVLDAAVTLTPRETRPAAAVAGATAGDALSGR